MAATPTDQAEADAPRPESIEALFLALESPLLRYALRYLRESDMAQDIVQEAFLRLHARFAEVREPRNWLYRTVHNLALNHQHCEFGDFAVVVLHGSHHVSADPPKETGRRGVAGCPTPRRP